jgi:protein arginine kinase activator
LRRNIDDLKNNLKEMIAKEEFERAAELRDEIRKLEKQLNADQKGGE